MSRIKGFVILSVLLISAVLLSSCGTGGTQTPPGTGVCMHNFSEWETVLESTCSQKGRKVRMCTLCQLVEHDDLELLAHTPEIIAQINPSCTAEGKTAGIKCSVCDAVIQEQQIIERTEHSYVNGVCSCGERDESIVTYTVTFVDYDGAVLGKQFVGAGNAATAPQAPERDGYAFVGWDKSFTNVTSDITVTAVYEKISTEPQFVVTNKVANRDDTIEVAVSLKNNPGIASIILSVAFDSDALTLTEVVYNTTIGGQTVEPQNMNSPLKLYWINGFADAEGDFVLATLKFTVKSDAAVGDHGITLSYNADDVYDISETNLPFEIVNGKITIE